MTQADREPRRTDRYHVAILGAGIAGSMLAAVLARNGVRVLLVDAATHPRFAVGESTIRTGIMPCAPYFTATLYT